MKTYCVEGFPGLEPVPTAAVIVARHKGDAADMLVEEVKKLGEELSREEAMDMIVLVDPATKQFIMLSNGDY